MQFRDVLQAVWRRRWLVVLVLAATTLFSALFALSRPTKYESASTLALTPSSSAGLITPEALNAVLGTYAQTAKSSLIKDKASKSIGEALPGSVETGTQSGTGIMQIIGTSENAEDAALVARATSRAFIEYLADNRFVEPEIVDPAPVPSSPVQPRPPLIIAIGILLGLIAGVLLAYFVEQFRGRIESAADIAELTSIPIIGALPYQRRLARGPAQLIWRDGEYEPLQESIRALRTNVEFQVQGRKAVLQVTSPLAGEGKSMLVANLGVALAQLGIETLIVDADLREPRQHAIFNIPNDTGLSTALRGNVGPKLRPVPTDQPQLSVLPSGPIPSNATEMLHVRAAPLFESLRASKAMVLIDSPPVLPVSDSRILARQADGVLLTVAAGAEKQTVLSGAIDTLQFAGGSIVGIVLNRSDDSASGGYGQERPQPNPAAKKRVAVR
jgi:succinoglycan biosynthesis transport protein ExoP